MTIYGERNQYRVVMAIRPGQGSDLSDVARLFVPTTTGQQVPLTSVATFSRSTAPLAVNHQGQFAAVTVSFGVDPGRSVGAMTAEIRRAVADLRLPETVNAAFGRDRGGLQQGVSARRRSSWSRH